MKIKLNFLNETKKILKFYQTDNELHGDKIVNSLSKGDAVKLFNTIDRARSEKPKGNITLGVITIDGKVPADEIATLKEAGFTEDMYVVYSLDNDTSNPVQGREGDYFLVKLPNANYWKNKPTLTSYVTSLYTATSRALKGSIVVEPDSNHLNYNISNKEENNTIEIPFPIDRIRKVKEDRLKELDAIIGNSEDVSEEKIIKTPEPVIEEDIEDTIIQEEPEENLTPKVIIDSVEQDENFNKDKKDLGHSMMVHHFYNRLGVNAESEGSDSYVYGKIDMNKTSEDLQVLSGAEGQIIDKKHIDHFITLKKYRIFAL